MDEDVGGKPFYRDDGTAAIDIRGKHIPLGLIRPMPAWLRDKKNAQDREEYYQDTIQPRHTSLDALFLRRNPFSDEPEVPMSAIVPVSMRRRKKLVLPSQLEGVPIGQSVGSRA